MAVSLAELFRTAMWRWLGPCAAARKIVKVTVRDEESRVVCVLDAGPELTAFRALWAALVEAEADAVAPSANRGPYYKLQIEYREPGGRTAHATWFYRPGGGTVEPLAIIRPIWVAPLYRTLTPAAFEAILGVNPP